MQVQELKMIVQNLLQRGCEGIYWDYKEDYTDCKEDKLIDIICMANNIDGHDAYLIYGANDDGIVTGIENTTHTRYTTKSVTEFLRSKPFAGGYVPKVSVQIVEIENHELDVLIIHSTRNTPYFLANNFSQSHDRKKHLVAGAIYTRVNDINTPRNQTASYEHTEHLWRRRFGMDMTPSEKFLYFLENTQNWSETKWDIDKHSYCKKSPEYQLYALESNDGYETLSYFYEDERMLYAPLELRYLTTTLYETELWYMDMGRCLIPKPEKKYMIEQGLFYYYIELDSLSGKLLPLFAYGKKQCNNRSGQQMPVLIFETEETRLSFEKWVKENIEFKNSYSEELKKSAIFQHIKDKESKDGSPVCGVLEVAISFKYYKTWCSPEEK